MSTTAERYAELEARIQKSDTDALLARLAFGLDLLAERGDAGRLPNGRIEELLHACNSRSTLDAFRLEVWRRMHFAERYPTEELALAALDTFGSWHRICDHGFGVAEPEAENTNDKPLGELHWETWDQGDDPRAPLRLSLLSWVEDALVTARDRLVSLHDISHRFEAIVHGGLERDRGLMLYAPPAP